ncbi:MAG: transcriptional repressor LexA [Pigmentiphaga sp.]|nr:transcriptional repressor LexA [Pigmentiphaga sp.]
MPKLTARQQQILDLIRQAIATTGFPPTRAEIAFQLGFRSPNAAEAHLKALAKKGVIELTAGTSRGIRVVQSDPDLAENDFLDFLSLPLIGRVAAGHPILAAPNIDKSLSVDTSLFEQIPDYLLQVRGLSMKDAGILEGDLLAVKRSKEARDGQIVVARLGDEVTVKRFERLPNGVRLHPANPDFQPIDVPATAEDFELEGIAVGLIRNTLIH